ncbi:MAG: DUF3800 domain-containing protein [Sphingomonas sp.]
MSTAKTQVWDIHPALSGVPSPARNRRLILALQAYIDDSGKDDPPVYILAGYIAPAEVWAEFSDRWNEALTAAPAISYFKMKEAFRRTGEFSGFSVAERDAKLDVLSGLVTNLIPIGIYTGTNHEEYADLFFGKVSTMFDNPYYLLCFSLIREALIWHELTDQKEPIQFIFDRQLGMEGNLIEGFANLAEISDDNLKRRIAGLPVYADDKDSLPLQAADMLAWHVRRAFEDVISERPTTRTASLDNIKFVPKIADFLTKEKMTEILSHMDGDPVTFLPSGKVGVLDHVYANLIAKIENVATIENLKSMIHCPIGGEVELLSIPAKELARYLLVDRCLACRIPHLHRKSGNVCLGQASVTALRNLQRSKG